MFNAPDKQTAEQYLQVAIKKFGHAAPQLSAWTEKNLAEGFAVFDFPLEHRRSIRATNSLERNNMEIHRRTLVVGVFPNEGSCLSLISGSLMEISEEWDITNVFVLAIHPILNVKWLFYRKGVASSSDPNDDWFIVK